MTKRKEQLAENARLWALYKQKPTLELKNILAERYTPLVYKIAKSHSRALPKVLDFNDIVQAGKIGLLDAIDRFDPDNERKAQFQTYATWRITGSIIDEINSMDWTPRSTRQKIKEVLRVREAHLKKENTAPTVKELSDSTGFHVDQVREILQQIDKTYITTYDNEIINFVAPPTDHDADEIRFQIKEAILKVLSEDEQRYVVLKFYQELSNPRIMEEMNLKASELRSLKDSAWKKLKDELG